MLGSYVSSAVRYHGNFPWTCTTRSSRCIHTVMMLTGERGARPPILPPVDDRDLIIPLYLESLGKEIALEEADEEKKSSVGTKTKAAATHRTQGVAIATSTVRFERGFGGNDEESSTGKPTLLFLPGLGGKGDDSSMVSI